MIHQYINNGYYIILDVNSGAVHSVDAQMYDVVEYLAGHLSDMEKPEKLSEQLREETKMALSGKYPAEEIRDCLDDAQELIDRGELFAADVYRQFVMDFKKRKTVVKALCLHVAHDCNLACRYCFAGEGEYHGERGLMSLETGKKALDFLVANSGNRRNLKWISSAGNR